MCFEVSASGHSADIARARSGPIIPNSIATQRLDETRLARRQQLRQYREIAGAGGADLQGRVHLDPQEVPARCEP